ncbi:hypothetical protein WJX74_010969 [Apatococcus lobatus]|uniref:Uncharacterized protein n=1 Tax=Apatococcus lobatus TaxID=904363 RepID=A0AAW1SFY7_9CHLO
MGPQAPCSVSKLTECRVKALTREVGTLREDLRREAKKREMAVARTKECEEACAEAESRAKALEYANKKLGQELATAKEAARISSSRNRSAINTLRDELRALEEATNEKAAEGAETIRCLMQQLQGLQGMMPGVASSAAPPSPNKLRARASTPPLNVHACWLPQTSLPLTPRERGVASLSKAIMELGCSQFGMEADEWMLPAVRQNTAEPVDICQSCSHPQPQVGQAFTAAAEHRRLLERLRNQADSMRERLEEVSLDRAALRQEVSMWQKVAQQQQQQQQASPPAASPLQPDASISTQLAALEAEHTVLQARHGGLEEEVRGLQGRMGELEGDNRGLVAENRHLKATVEEAQSALSQQRNLSRDLQSTVDDQRADIRAALDLVLGKHGHLPCVAAQQAATQAEQPPQLAWPDSTRISATQPPSSSSSKLQVPDSLSGYPPRGDAPGAEDLWARLTGPQRRHKGNGRGRDIDALAQDMQALDTDIASLEATLHSAGL